MARDQADGLRTEFLSDEDARELLKLPSKDNGDASHEVAALTQAVQILANIAVSLVANQGRTVRLATLILKDAYPFPEPHFSADVITSEVDKTRPVGAQKRADLTLHEATGIVAVRGVRRNKSEWVCLIPVSNIKGMLVAEDK